MSTPILKQLVKWDFASIFLNINGIRITQGGPDAFVTLNVLDPEIVKTQVGQDGTTYAAKSTDRRVRLDISVMQNARDCGILWQLAQAQMTAPPGAGIPEALLTLNEITSKSGVSGRGVFTNIPDAIDFKNQEAPVMFGFLLPYGRDTLKLASTLGL